MAMKKFLSIILLLIFCLILLPRCKKDKGDPPVLPPRESMMIDFSNFDTQSKSARLTSDTKGTENSNWDYAAVTALTWKTIINTSLAVPVASFKLAIDQSPSWVSEKTWQWSYNVPVGGITYKARLTGQIRSTDIEWKMYITKEGTGGYTDFLWFEGTSNNDGSGGQWTIYESNANPVEMINITWTKTGASVGMVKYTYVKTGNFKDSYIEYGLTGNALNAYYKIHYFNGVKFSDVDIEWSTTNHNGRIRSLDYLGDTNWYCWNENKINITCP
jgi:hypothetical protein